MKNNRIPRFALIANLAICSLWLLCINHELYFVPLLTVLLLVRIWASFSMYRRSRMALCPIVLLVGMVIYIWANPYSMSYELFLMPWITLARGVLSLFGTERSTIETFFEWLHGYGWEMGHIINVAAVICSAWLFILPLGVYSYWFFKQQLLPGRLTLCKNIGLCAYMLGIIALLNGSAYSGAESIATFLLTLFFIPLIFNRGQVKGLFSRGDIAVLATLALLAVGYVCGVGMEEKSMITASLLPVVFYYLVNWWQQREIRYREIVPVVLGAVSFAGAQYETGALRLRMLLAAAALAALVATRFAVKTRMYWAAAGLFAMTALIIPVLCIGYNPYSVLGAVRSSHCSDYTQAPNGLMYVRSKQGYGIRDRFGIVLPAEYRRVQILRHWMPYFKVGKEGSWQIYDIERHELVCNESFSEVLPYNDMAFVLKSDDGDRYLMLPEHYDRRALQQLATVTDIAPEEK